MGQSERRTSLHVHKHVTLSMNLASHSSASNKWNLFPSTPTAQVLLHIVCVKNRCSKEQGPFFCLHSTGRACSDLVTALPPRGKHSGIHITRTKKTVLVCHRKSGSSFRSSRQGDRFHSTHNSWKRTRRIAPQLSFNSSDLSSTSCTAMCLGFLRGQESWH